MSSIALCLVFPFLMAYAAASDLLTMLIPNRVTALVALAFGVYALGAGLGPTEIGLHLAAGLATLVLTFTLFSLGYVGGGDAKLAAATALWLGFDHLADYLLASTMLGGALTLAILVARSHPMPNFTTRLPFAVHLHDAKTGIPYGIALAAAALVVVPTTDLWARLILA